MKKLMICAPDLLASDHAQVSAGVYVKNVALVVAP